ncbi:MAG: phenylalanine--tRNA ligase subunit beta [Candidatus Andersenbacteria bacterium]|nr:phenylalanine--tRNA ligase subunit beta [Candidatus Andersenbacteria bacterium]
MKLSTNWIKELVPGLQLSGLEIAELLTNHSFETVVEHQYVIDPAITVAQILKLEQHPNADRLRLATITDGENEIRVVCGAPNISEGDVVPYSPPGTKVYDEDGKLFELSVAKIRGVESPGMLNSARELGLSNDHGGIFLLPKDTPLGTKLSEYIAGDTLLEADILPDRAHDCLSHIGVAREVAALTKLSVQEPETMELPEASEQVDGWNVRIENPASASRVMGIVFEGAQEGAETPIVMQARLLSLGARPINPIVDCTNYVMFEYGQPSHAYDQAKLQGKNIAVTETKSEVLFSALNGKLYQPAHGDLLIECEGETIGLAGIVGGTSSQVDNATNNIFLEVATFNAFAIQQASAHIGLRTEAASRFSKGISPVVAGVASSRLAQLIISLTGAQMRGVIDTNPEMQTPKPIMFRPARVSAYAGTEISADISEDILMRLGFSIEKASEDQWEIIAPAQRLDILGEHDLIDEVVRVHGLSVIAESDIAMQAPAVAVSDEVYWMHQVREKLVELGFTETYSYSFEDEVFATLVNSEIHPHVELLNPMAPELKKLRYSMLPGLLSAMITSRDEMHRDKNGVERALFEIGRVYHVGDTGVVPGVIERKVIAGISVGSEDRLQEVMDAFVAQYNLAPLDVREVEKPFGKCLQYSYAGEFFGIGYVFSAELLKKMKYRMPVVAFEVSVAALMKHAPDVEIPVRSLQEVRDNFKMPNQFMELPKFPSVFRDISILVPSDTGVDAVESAIDQVGGELVVDVDVFDEFSQDGDDTKSLAFHVEYRSPDRTLTDKEISEIHKKIEHALKHQFSAEIR